MKALVITNVVAFLVTLIVPEMIYSLGLRPADVLSGRIWQPFTRSSVRASNAIRTSVGPRAAVCRNGSRTCFRNRA